jgi:hypothetical protein
MPKWSQIPWGTVITGLVAVYGAALSTLNYYRAGPKLRFEVQINMLTVPSTDKRKFIASKVTNYGNRPTTLTNITVFYFEKPWSWARLRNRPTTAAVLNLPNDQQPFPWELKLGAVWIGLTPQDDIADWGSGVLYFDLHHSHRNKPLRRRVPFPVSTPISKA